MQRGRRQRLSAVLACGIFAASACTPDGEAFNGEEEYSPEEGEVLIERSTAALITNNCGDMAGLAQGAPWPMRGGCPTHAAQASTHGSRINTLNWRVSLGAAVTSSPAIGADGTIYVGADNAKLFAVNKNGTIKWQIALGTAPIESSPAIANDGTIYIGANNGLYAINPNGTIRWSYMTLGSTKSSPVVAGDGTVYFGSTDTALYAFNPDGTKKWAYIMLSPIEGAPTVGPDGTIYTTSMDNVINAIRPDGTNRWFVRPGFFDSNKTTPLVVGGRVYAGSMNNTMYAYDAATGAAVWERALDNTTAGTGIASSAAVGPTGTLYFGGNNNRVNAYKQDGTKLWSFDTAGDVISSPTVDMDGNVYVGSDDTYVYALNGTTGAALWSYKTGGTVRSSPALDNDGTVYVGSNDGYLYSIGKGTLAGTCGVDYPCTYTVNSGTDTHVSSATPSGSFGTTTPMTVSNSGGDSRALISFSAPSLFNSISKRAELVSATLVLSRIPVAGSGTGTLSAHRMLRSYNAQNATWTCANDTNPSSTAVTCAASDVWSMTTGTLPYATTSSNASVTFGASTDISLDVTADVRWAMQNDADSLAWLLRVSAGTGRLDFGTKESGAPARIVLSFRPDTQLNAERDADITALYDGATEKTQTSYNAWLAWAATCELARAAQGQSTDPVYTKLVAAMTADDKAAVVRLRDDNKTIAYSVSTRVLGPFASLDPRACTARPNFERARSIAKARASGLEGRIRANLCVNDNDNVTVGATVVRDPGTPEFPGPGKTVPDARPILVGIDPTPYKTEDPNWALEYGHPALIQDWRDKRSNGTTAGDGLSPFGVKTTTACNASTYSGDTCNHDAGLICGTLLRNSQVPIVDQKFCYAFPITFNAEVLAVRGHNFWDAEAQLTLKPLFGAGEEVAYPATKAQANESNVPVNGALTACKPATNLTRRPSMWAQQLTNQNELHFTPDVKEPGFYSVKIYNKNGVYRTPQDASAGREGGRTIHVCRAEEDPTKQWEVPTEGTRRGCTEPTQTCDQSGANCTATWSTPPRPLSACLTDGAGAPERCGETPNYFSSEGDGSVLAIVYVAEVRPTFVHQAHLWRVECREETGCNHCGGDDEFKLMMATYTDAQLAAAKVDPANFAAKNFGSYGNDFNHGQIRKPRTRLLRVPDLRRSDVLNTELSFVEDDSNTITRTRVFGSIATAALVAYGGLIGTIGAPASVSVTEMIVASARGVDNLGRRKWYGTFWDMQKRVDYTHTPDFLVKAATDSRNPGVLPFSSEFKSGTAEATLLHPVVGYGTSLSGIAPQCGTGTTLTCASGFYCYVNRCLGTSEREGWLSWPNGFRTPATDDPLYGRGYAARYYFSRDGGKYQADLDLVMCPSNYTGTRCEP